MTEPSQEAAEALYESMHGLYRPWCRLEPKKKAGWVKALQAAYPHIEADLRAKYEEEVERLLLSNQAVNAAETRLDEREAPRVERRDVERAIQAALATLKEDL